MTKGEGGGHKIGKMGQRRKMYSPLMQKRALNRNVYNKSKNINQL